MPSLIPYAGFALELALSTIAPARCAACDHRVPLRTVFCHACASTLVRAERRDPELISGFDYGGAIERAIVRFKFEQREDLAVPLADALFRAVSEESLVADIVVPVPLHPMRLVERGYNQSALLARPIAKRLSAEFIDGALRRTRNTPHQVGQGREARAENILDAFAVRDDRRIRGANVVVVDDVVTTGATLAACRDALVGAGAAAVRKLTLAVSVL